MCDIGSTVTLPNGITMPRIGLGVWRVEQEGELRTAVEAALAAGYRHIDTATHYDNEEMVGRAIADFGRREEIFLTTKLQNPDQGDPERALEISLRKLGTDYVDLYLIHWPSPWRGQYIEAWKTMVGFLWDGRAKAIGVSNFKAHHIEAIVEATGVKPAVNQVERHPFYQQDVIASYCRTHGIVLEAYSPLGSGHLEELTPLVAPIAEKYGKTPAQVILRWHLQTDWVLIPKSVTPSRIAQNVDIFDFELEPEELDAIALLDRNIKYLPDPDDANF